MIEEAAALGIPSERADHLIGRICRRSNVARDRGDRPDCRNSRGSSSIPRPRRPMPMARPSSACLRCRHCTGVTEMSPVARKSEFREVPALRGIAEVGLPGLQEEPLGRRTAVRLRVPPGVCVSRVVRHFEAAQNAFRNFELDKALEHLARVQEFAPEPGWRAQRGRQDHGRGRPRSPASSSLTRRRGRAAGWYPPGQPSKHGAGWSIRHLPISWRPGPSWRKSLRRAESLAARARNLERTDPSAARDLYRQSLAIAADLPEALTGLETHAAGSTDALDAQVLGDRIRLSWTPPPPDGLGPLTFVIVRKRGASLDASRRRHPDRRGQHERI